MDKSYTSKFKLIVKVLTLLLVLNVSKSWGQATLPVSRTAWGTTPTGWTDSGTSTYLTTFACSGSDGGKLDNTGDYYQVFYNGPASSLSFVTKSSAAYTGTFDIQESPDGTSWTTVSSYTAMSTSCVTNNLSLNCTSRYIRFYYTLRNVNITIDDVAISTGTCSSCSAPTTTLSTTSQTLCTSTASSFSVGTSATVPTYTWEASANNSTWAQVVNGTPTGASYSVVTSGTTSILQYTTGTSGITYYYHCLVAENNTCTATSSSNSVTVNAPPTISSQPSSRSICSGASTTFTITSSAGSTKQWQYSSDAGATFTNVPVDGTHSNVTTTPMNLTTPSTTLSGYVYQCIISVAGCSSVTSNTVLLTVNQTPSAPPTPTPLANPACSSTSLSVMTSTVAGVTWYWETTSGGTSTSSITTTAYNVTSSGTYYVRAQSNTGACWSAAGSVSVTVNSPDLITSGASNNGICSETNTSFAVVGLAAGTPKKWQVSTDNGVTFIDVVAGAPYSGSLTNSTLSLTNTPVGFNGYQYQCVVSVPGCPVITSTIGVLTVTQTPGTPPVPTALVNPACSSTSLSAMSSTVAGVTWYWQGTNSAGTTTTNPTSSAYNVSSTGTYYVRGRTDGSSCLSSSSSTAITINQPPTITSNPPDRTQCVGANTTFTVSASGTGISYLWQVDNGGGFANLANGAPYSNVTTAVMTITGITAGMNGYKYRCVINGTSPCASATSNYGTLIITGAGTPATPASAPATNAIACNGFNLSWTNGSGSNRLVVVKSGSAIAGSPVDGTSYAANSTFGSGSTIAAGEFVVYNGSNSSVFITGLNASTTYYYKVFEFNGCSLNYLTSGTVPNGNETTISCSSPAGINAVYVDACSGTCTYEGNNELIWGVTGSYAFKIAANGPTLHYNSSTPPTSTFISTYNLNATNVGILNTAVTSCTNTVFVDPNTQGYIPPNSNFLIANNCMCSPSAYDFSGLCGSGPIYVVFGNNAAWPCNSGGGIFGNSSACSGNTPRYFDLNFASWGVALDPIYDYDPCLLTGGSDGDVILLNPSGGSAVTYTNSGCTVPLIILPIELVDFYATKNGKKNEVVWKVASEENIVYYTIDKSNDGVNFTELATVFSNNATQRKAYNVIDDSPFDDITYYRLGTKEKDGKVYYHKIISVDEKSTDWNSIHYQQEQNLIIEFKNTVPKNSTINLFDLSGKQMTEVAVKESHTTINTQTFAEGIYFLKIATPYKTENFKIIITK